MTELATEPVVLRTAPELHRLPPGTAIVEVAENPILTLRRGESGLWSRASDGPRFTATELTLLAPEWTIDAEAETRTWESP